MNTWKHGVAWKNDKLYHFDDRQIVVMRLWPEMLAWRRTKTKLWTPTRCHADQFLSGCELPDTHEIRAGFVGPYSYWVDELHRRQSANVYLPALAGIPLREANIAFRLKERRWHALALMARCPGASDLFESNAGLAFCLASNWVFHRPRVTQHMRSARSLITKKQTEIQEWLGFPATERVRKILRKMDPSVLRIRTLARFQWAIQKPRIQDQLAQLPRITGCTLDFICDFDAQPRLTSDFLHQLNDESLPLSEAASIFKLWLDLKFQLKMLGDCLPDTLHSLKQLRRLHNLISIKYLQANIGSIRYAIFGMPPYRGTNEIVPITTGNDLVAEGKAMSHCVASRASLIRQDSYYVYRVTSPVRATMAITQVCQSWKIAELKGADNLCFSDELAMDLLHRLKQSNEQLDE